jgi:hypothetical protein
VSATYSVSDEIRALAATVPSRLDRATVEQALAMYAAGVARSDIADALCIGRQTVQNLRMKAGLEPNRAVPAPSIPEAEIERVCELYDEGRSIEQVGAETGMSVSQVRRRLALAGHRRRPQHRNINPARVVLPDGFMSSRQVENAVGIAASRVRQLAVEGKIDGAIRVPWRDQQVWGIPESEIVGLRTRWRRRKAPAVVSRLSTHRAGGRDGRRRSSVATEARPDVPRVGGGVRVRARTDARGDLA